MRLVPRALTSPSRCAVLPYIGPDHPDGYFDTGSELPGRGDQFDSHVYVSVVAAREMARMLGYHSPEAMQAVQEVCENQRAELELAREEIERLEVVLGAIDTLESRDFRARKKPGRPKVVEEGVVA